MKVILISGKAGHGKDTVANILQEEIKNKGYKVMTTHYGDLVKYICGTYFGWDGNKDEAGRTLLQHVGTDIVRKKNPDFWVDFIASILTYFDGNWDYVLIPDVRFKNEIRNIKDTGIDTVHLRVIRDNYEGTLTEEQKKHPSETALDDVSADVVIKNNGTVSELSETLKEMIGECL